MDNEEHTNGNGLATTKPAAITQHETTTAHSAALAKAEVEARFQMAILRPRDNFEARRKLLERCKQPIFAAMARYAKPIGQGKVEGPSIRFVEEALKALGNVDIKSPTVFEDDQKRIVRVTVCDLESNSTYSTDVPIAKTIERRRLKQGQQALGSRQNSYGETVYLIEASDDELLVKQSALISKAVRTLGLRLIPGDLVDEGQQVAIQTARNEDAKDPAAARKKMLDLFMERGVRPGDLEAYLGHSLDVIPPHELDDLRAIYAAIRDQHTSWAEVMAGKSVAAEDGEKPKSKIDAAKQTLRNGKGAKQPETEPGASDAPDEAAQ